MFKITDLLTLDRVRVKIGRGASLYFVFVQRNGNGFKVIIDEETSVNVDSQNELDTFLAQLKTTQAY